MPAAFRKLYAIWIFLNTCLLAAGVVCILFSVICITGNHVIVNLIFARIDSARESRAVQYGKWAAGLTAVGIVLGAVYLFTCLLSVPAILQPADRSRMLKLFNIWLLAVGSLTLAVSTK